MTDAQGATTQRREAAPGGPPDAGDRALREASGDAGAGTPAGVAP